MDTPLLSGRSSFPTPWSSTKLLHPEWEASPQNPWYAQQFLVGGPMSLESCGVGQTLNKLA